MWDAQKQQRLNDLQRRAEHAPLAADQQGMLDELLGELEQAEWALLGPEVRRLSHHQEQVQRELSQAQAQNAALVTVAERYADLLERARRQLSALVAERAALGAEYERALP